jgi:hypothetical protein
MNKMLAAGFLMLGCFTAPASAAQFILAISPGAGSANFGNTTRMSGPLTDMFRFSVPAGSANGFVGSIALSNTLDVVIEAVFLDSKPFDRLSSDAFDLFRLPSTNIAAGDHVISVNGSWGSNGGSYAGTLNYVAAVPEPATWLMLLAGFGVIGGRIRRDKRRQSTVRVADTGTKICSKS